MSQDEQNAREFVRCPDAKLNVDYPEKRWTQLIQLIEIKSRP